MNSNLLHSNQKEKKSRFFFHRSRSRCFTWNICWCFFFYRLKIDCAVEILMRIFMIIWIAKHSIWMECSFQCDFFLFTQLNTQTETNIVRFAYWNLTKRKSPLCCDCFGQCSKSSETNDNNANEINIASYTRWHRAKRAATSKEMVKWRDELIPFR